MAIASNIYPRWIALGIIIYVSIEIFEYLFLEFITSGFRFPFQESFEPPPGAPTTTPAPTLTFFVNSFHEFLIVGTWLVPGYIVGRKAGLRGLLHGFIVGFIGFALWQLAFAGLIAPRRGEDLGLIPDSYVLAAFWTAFLCALAGGVGELHASKGFHL